jgi:hypothetical protein
MRTLARDGWSCRRGRLSVNECVEVAEYLIAQSVALGVRLDLRHLVYKEYPDYLQYRAGHASTHWRDLVDATLREGVGELAHTRAAGVSRRERVEEQSRLAGEIAAQFPEHRDQVDAWQERTGMGERSYQRAQARARRLFLPQGGGNGDARGGPEAGG